MGQCLPVVVGCGSVFTCCSWPRVSVYLLSLAMDQCLPAGAGCVSVFPHPVIGEPGLSVTAALPVLSNGCAALETPSNQRHATAVNREASAT